MFASNDALRGRLSYLVLFCLVSLASSRLAIAESKLLENLSEPDTPAIQLSQEEILQAFADVRDDAKVQDAAGTLAVNHWYADGRFVSRWSNGVDSGEVVGTWRVENNRRCITISKGVPQRVGKESCGPIFRRGSTYLTFNTDGSIHGIHTLTPLQNKNPPVK